MSFKIRTFNKISEAGLQLFNERYEITDSEASPDGILVRSAKIDTDQFAQSLAIARAGAGVNNITVTKATEKGICVFNTPGANANAVAELVFATLGMTSRNILAGVQFAQDLSQEQDDKVISERVEKEKSNFRGTELSGKTLGVIGIGKIGVLVANGGAVRGMRVMAFDPFPNATNFHQLSAEVEYAREMDQIFAECDIISVHVPLAEKTRGMIGKAEIAKCKESCVFLNFARKGVYDDDAMLEALSNNQAGLYITDFPSRALISHPKTLCTPHLGASTAESEENCAVMAVRQMKNFLEYGCVSNSVNFPVIDVVPQQAARSRLVVVNRDIPNMISGITKVLGEEGVNILSFSNESNGQIGYNIIDFETELSGSVLEKVSQLPDVIRARVIQLKP